MATIQELKALQDFYRGKDVDDLEPAGIQKIQKKAQPEKEGVTSKETGRDRKKHTREKKVRNQEPLEVEAEQQVREARVVLPQMEQRELVWYPEMLDDLRLATFPDKLLSVEEREKRYEAAQRLREKGINLPGLSLDYVENNPAVILRYENRQKLRAAAEFLRDPNLKQNDFWNREEAVNYLTSLGIDIKPAQTQPLENNMTEIPAKVNYSWMNPVEDNPFWGVLFNLANTELWNKVMLKIDNGGLSDKEKADKLKVLMALVRIKSEPGMFDRVSGDERARFKRFWDEQKGRLADLGIEVV